MATVAHIIYSRYDTKNREIFLKATGQVPQGGDSRVDDSQRDDADDLELAWSTIDSSSARRLAYRAPRFVPETGQPYTSTSSRTLDTELSIGTASWYRAITNGSSSKSEVDATVDAEAPASTLVATATSHMSSMPSLPVEPIKRCLEPRTKNNWFILNALASDTEPNTVPDVAPSTLADMLARDPPPKPDDAAKFVPPVFLTLGPANKGWRMLQQQGWDEGEAVGLQAARRGLGGGPRPSAPFTTTHPHRQVLSRPEGIINLADDEMIDLTVSGDEETTSDRDEKSFEDDAPYRASSPGSHRSLLTPIPTVLKSDRLGIGLKAKTTGGPYHAPQKRVTHSAAALAAHVKVNEAAKLKRSEVGRGRRGYEKVRRKEEQHRKQLLAYMNE